MLQRIRDRSRSWGAKIIVGAVVVTMALFGVESLVGLFGGGGDEVAKVNGQSITRQELEMEVQRAIRSGQVPPEQERALRGQVLDEMIGERLLLAFAEDGGLYLSDEQLDQVIEMQWMRFFWGLANDETGEVAAAWAPVRPGAAREARLRRRRRASRSRCAGRGTSATRR